MRRYQPRLVHGYCQSLVDLARWILAEGVIVPVRAVSTTVEPLFDEHRRVLEAAFGCPAFDQYGCGEAEAIAMECPAHSGLHVTDERVVLELGEGGEVIVTDLDNLAFPFIRYRNGDLAVAADGDCRCGRHTRRLSRIIGRTGDAIVGLGGQRLHPEFFTHLINETGIAAARDLRRYQVVQETPRRLVWKLVSRPLTPADERRLVQALRDHLGEIEIAIQIVDDIPASASGKFRYVVNRS